MDTIGEILWFAMFFTPLITMPLVWRYSKGSSRAIRVMLGLLLAFVLSFVLFTISMGIFLRDGLGPT